MSDDAIPETSERDDAIRIIRAELKRRSGRAWSVTGGRGTAWGWIRITAPPRRRDGWGMTEEDRGDLADLLGLEWVNGGGVSIPASSGHRIEFVDRARGRTLSTRGVQYWD